MIRAFKVVRPQPFPGINLCFAGSRNASLFRFAHNAVSSPQEKNRRDMDESADPKLKNGDVMENSFGEGYATRSDEEGFGGIYGGNQSLRKADIDKEIHGNHPAYDKSQGSEVKEREKARHQTHISH